MVNTTARMGTTVVMINFAMLKILLVLLVLISFWSSGTFLSNPWWLITSSSSLNNSIIVKRTTYPMKCANFPCKTSIMFSLWDIQFLHFTFKVCFLNERNKLCKYEPNVHHSNIGSSRQFPHHTKQK